MDFLECLCNRINQIEKLPVVCTLGITDTGENLRLYPVQGGEVTQTYFDGSQEEKLNYTLAYKSGDQEKANNVLWRIQKVLEKLKDLASQDGSFIFRTIRVTNKPYIDRMEEGLFVFLITVQVEITTI